MFNFKRIYLYECVCLFVWSLITQLFCSTSSFSSILGGNYIVTYVVLYYSLGCIVITQKGVILKYVIRDVFQCIDSQSTLIFSLVWLLDDTQSDNLKQNPIKIFFWKSDPTVEGKSLYLKIFFIYMYLKLWITKNFVRWWQKFKN